MSCLRRPQPGDDEGRLVVGRLRALCRGPAVGVCVVTSDPGSPCVSSQSARGRTSPEKDVSEHRGRPSLAIFVATPF